MKKIGTTFEEFAVKQMTFFTRFLHGFFGIVLVITVLLALSIFFKDVFTLLVSSQWSSAIVHALGSLLLLWTLSELLNSELRVLKGEKFKTSVMVEVAIAAFIRKMLIMSAEGININDGAFYLVTIIVLSITYWLLSQKGN